MHQFVIMRRNAWNTREELEAAAARSARVCESMKDEARWIRSYVVREPSGNLATVCIYEAISDSAAREHALRAGLRADEVLLIVDTVVVTPDAAVAPRVEAA